MSTFGYVVIDSRTGAIVSRCKTLRGASRAADRRDQEYGACRYRARAAMPSESASFKPTQR
jgi:hypothetical protein